MKWRKFIQQIIHHKKIKTIETLLSTKQYDLIEFKTVPSKAFNLYKKSFERIPELTERYSEFLKQVFIGKEKIHTNTHYLINLKKKDDIIEKFLESRELNSEILPLKVIRKYLQFVSI
jgi:hypothetical protein